MPRHLGVMLPLFSAPSSRSWGIGELPDLALLADWLASAGCDRLMLLPIGTVAPGETSPYAAASSMAIDPIYIAFDDVPEFTAAGGESRLSTGGRRAMDEARAAPIVRYGAVRRAKREALDIAFAHFVDREWRTGSPRARALEAYAGREAWWLDDEALYRAIAGAAAVQGWRAWEPPLRDRDPAAIAAARRQYAREILREQYAQWIAESQWQDARRRARDAGVFVFGDLPFMVNADSAEVWRRPGDVMFDVSLGVPPDAFSATGQDWGLPTYRWSTIADGDYEWIRARARRMAALFDGYRVDHLVGLYRTYGRPRDGEPSFNPATEDEQVRQGEAVLAILLSTGVDIIAEDLGVVPDFVRASLARLGIPGCKVLRWERAWHEPGQPFVDPVLYPAVSAAMTGTHDTSTLAAWWQEADQDERQALLNLPSLHASGLDVGQPFTARLRDQLLRLLYGSRSRELLVPVQDVFGWQERINVPGTVGEHNWTWRLPWPVDALSSVPEAIERAGFCRRLAAGLAAGARR